MPYFNLKQVSISIILLFFFFSDITAKNNSQNTNGDIELFISLLNNSNEQEQNDIINKIDENWRPNHSILLIEIINLLQNNNLLTQKLLRILERKTGKSYGFDLNKWYQWIWKKEPQYPEGYVNFKAKLYKLIDPKFEKYFLERNNQITIRLDEVRWGGVKQDGIPPLRYPNMLSAFDASYLNDNDIVFGVEINGDARAYPKRILAWHEMFVDEIGDTQVAGVYCTLCGTVIIYKTELNGKNYDMGTSGFLYRSNKLMYDKKTQSLWNTFMGSPVIGPLVNKGIQLDHLSVVTTTWAEWKKRHPETLVLSVQTGYNRNYNEGEAYKDYFATDKLMFNTPYKDKRLKNKDEILAIRLPGNPKEQFAVSIKFLLKNPIYTDKIGITNFIILTDNSGGNRVYETQDVKFVSYDRENVVIDDKGNTWELTESFIVSKTGKKLKRLPYHRAFWFGWHAAFPETRLVK